METVNIDPNLLDDMVGLSYILEKEELKKHTLIIDDNDAEPEGLT